MCASRGERLERAERALRVQPLAPGAVSLTDVSSFYASQGVGGNTTDRSSQPQSSRPDKAPFPSHPPSLPSTPTHPPPPEIRWFAVRARPHPPRKTHPPRRSVHRPRANVARSPPPSPTRSGPPTALPPSHLPPRARSGASSHGGAPRRAHLHPPPLPPSSSTPSPSRGPPCSTSLPPSRSPS